MWPGEKDDSTGVRCSWFGISAPCLVKQDHRSHRIWLLCEGYAVQQEREETTLERDSLGVSFGHQQTC